MLDTGCVWLVCDRRRLLSAADLLVGQLCVPLLTTVGWWGVWTAAELLQPSSQWPTRVGWQSAGAGALLVYLHAIWRQQLQHALCGARRAWYRHCAARAVLLLLLLGHVLLWRGVFLLGRQLLTGDRWSDQLATALVSALILIGMRSLRSALRPPLHITTDTHLLTLDTPLQCTCEYVFRLRSVDGVSTVLVCCVVALLWSSVWRLTDQLMLHLLQHHSLLRSAFGSLALGYLLCAGCCWCSLLTIAPHTQHNSPQPLPVGVLIETAFLLAAFVGALNVWRGMFLLADLLFYSQLDRFGGYGALVALAAAAVSAVALSVCRLGSNLLLPGATRDNWRDLSLNVHCLSRLLHQSTDEDESRDRGGDGSNINNNRDETMI